MSRCVASGLHSDQSSLFTNKVFDGTDQVRANGLNPSKTRNEGSVHRKHEPIQKHQSLRMAGIPRHRQGDI